MKAENIVYGSYDGSLTMQFYPLKCISNVFNAYFIGNARPQWMIDYQAKAWTAFHTEALKPLRDWSLDPSQLGLDDIRKKMAKIFEKDHLNSFMKAILSRPLHVPNIGDAMRRDILGTDGWDQRFFWSPGLAYPIVRAVFNSDMGYDTEGLTTTKIESSLMYVPAPGSTFSKNLATTLGLIDRPRFSAQLIPGLGDHGVHKAKDVPVGVSLAFDEQIESMFALGVLYALQGSVFFAHLHSAIYDRAWTDAWNYDANAHTTLTAKKEERDWLLKNVPLHPLLSYIVSAFKPVSSVETYYGKKDLYYRAAAMFHDPNARISDLKREKPNFRDQYLAMALLERTRSNISDTWDFSKPNGNSMISMDSLARRVLATDTVHTHFKEIASKLGWSEGGLKTSVGPLRQNGADYILTDGEGYSGPPANGLLGLTPVLSMGNAAYMGQTRRRELFFNVTANETIQFSLVTVEGHQAPTEDYTMYERTFQPATANMGEDDVTIIRSSTVLEDPVMRGIVEHFAHKWNRCLHLYYEMQNRLPAPKLEGDELLNVLRSDWDWAVDADSRESVLATASKLYQNQWFPSIADGILLRRPKFFFRVPVELAREGHFDLFDELGCWVKPLEFDGGINFVEDDSKLSHDGREFNAIIEYASPAPVSPSAQAAVTKMDAADK